MSRFFLTGDCHGEFEKIEFFCRHRQTSRDDYMIILGDAGINFCMDSRDEKLFMVIMKNGHLTFQHIGKNYGMGELFIMKMHIQHFCLQKMVKYMI